jgi:hypothetical protein
LYDWLDVALSRQLPQVTQKSLIRVEKRYFFP